MPKLLIGFGSNLGQSIEIFTKALNRLVKEFKLIEVSPLYRSSAIEYLEQPDFLNFVASFYSPYSVEKTFTLIRNIENKISEKKQIHKGPRELDLDLLLFQFTQGSFYIEALQETLTLPHPRFLQRSFTLLPFLDLSESQFWDNFIALNFPQSNDLLEFIQKYPHASILPPMANPQQWSKCEKLNNIKNWPPKDLLED